jgi:cytochrome c oxidase cbb3-type subunit 3
MARDTVGPPASIPDTGHEWDGIKELDNPLPRWWLVVWWITIVIAIGYWIAFPAWPGIKGYTHGVVGQSDRAKVVRDLAALDKLRGARMVQLKTATPAEIEADPQLQAYALMVGQKAFNENCVACHGQGGTGSKGYANLRDDVWLWGGSLPQIQHTITYGIRTGAEGARYSKMPSFGHDGLLTDAQISDLVEDVVSLSGRKANTDAVARATPLFSQNCATCHGPAGKGDQTKGAPDLTDKEWLYGPDRASIRSQIVNGRGGVMPTWGPRLSPETIKALTVYVHVNAAG